MIIILERKRIIVAFTILLLVILVFTVLNYVYPAGVTLHVDEELSILVQNIFNIRCKAILEYNEKLLQSLYDIDTKYGIWAFEHELKRMRYLKLWADKQGVKFTSIKSKPIIRYANERDAGYRINLLTSTEYKYVYQDEPDTVNTFRIGTYHSLDILERDGRVLITREWYTDPFADSLNLDKIKTEEIKAYILSGNPRDFSGLNERRVGAVKYADKYCGAAATEENGFSYNEKYINYNSRGGDCANFASQILHEGGKFPKNYTWNYNKGGTKAWVNAQAFKDYMLYSGRASRIAYGTYNQVYKASYKLLPGDFIAYEKKGKVKHISVVTGADSKGYALVNCHNTDRYRVPWDLGWSNSSIRFWLVRVHY